GGPAGQGWKRRLAGALGAPDRSARRTRKKSVFRIIPAVGGVEPRGSFDLNSSMVLYEVLPRSSAMRFAVGKSIPVSAASTTGEAVLTLMSLVTAGRTVTYGSSAATVLASKPRIKRSSSTLAMGRLAAR